MLLPSFTSITLSVRITFCVSQMAMETDLKKNPSVSQGIFKVRPSIALAQRTQCCQCACNSSAKWSLVFLTLVIKGKLFTPISETESFQFEISGF